jgi:glycosyltransferase involved in cell wall biosynthesis
MAYKASLMVGLHRARPGVSIGVLESPYSEERLRLVSLGDPVIDPVVLEATEMAVEEFRGTQMEPGRVWLTVAGALGRRKRVDLALDAIAQSGSKRFGLLLAGEIEEDYREELLGQARRADLSELLIEWISRPLSNAEMSVVIASADASLVLYETPNPPSSLGKALAAGTLSIVAGPEPLRRYARRYPESAWECEPTPKAVSGLLNRIVEGNRVPAEHLPDAADFVCDLLREGRGR